MAGPNVDSGERIGHLELNHMSVDTRLAAFVEYVVRPLSDDWRQILEQLNKLQLPLTESFLKHSLFYLGCWHLAGECIRAVSYIVVTTIICRTLLVLWPLLH